MHRLVFLRDFTFTNLAIGLSYQINIYFNNHWYQLENIQISHWLDQRMTSEHARNLDQIYKSFEIFFMKSVSVFWMARKYPCSFFISLMRLMVLLCCWPASLIACCWKTNNDIKNLLLEINCSKHVHVAFSCNSSMTYKIVTCKNGGIGCGNNINRKKGTQILFEKVIMQVLRISNLC